MTEPTPEEYREATPPFVLPDAFKGTRLLYNATPTSAAAAGATTAPLAFTRASDFMLLWKLVDAGGATLREGAVVIKGIVAEGPARKGVAAFAAWYTVLREIAEQNDVRFHPASEIPLTLTHAPGDVRSTPPHFFTS